MAIKSISPFKPVHIKNYKPKNISIYTFNAGFKKRKKDLLIIVFEKLIPVAAAYSKTSTPSAPIIWNKKNNTGLCKILIVNSGNANAHTGNQGINEIEKYVRIAAKYFLCKKNQIYISSTGIIGEQIDSSKIIKSILSLSKNQNQSILDAAKAIMTTDTFPKVEVSKIRYKSMSFNIYGIAKGSGMIAPNMGTMLAYIFIEASLRRSDLKKLLKKHLESTFNSITVDGDTSTNDSIMIFSCSAKKIQSKVESVLFKKISNGLSKVMKSLSQQIITDGEGISKLIEVEVTNAKDINQAKRVAFSIANSLLVKTAIAGEDANWGRVVMAIGKSDKDVIQEKIIIKFKNLIVSKYGKMYSNINTKKLNHYMKNKKININVNLNLGNHNTKVWSSDLTHKYITLNSVYTT